MCEAPSTCRARMWLIEPRFFRAEYSGLIAAPGTPKAQVTPSFSRTRTAASIAFMRAMAGLPVADVRTARVDDLRQPRPDVIASGSEAIQTKAIGATVWIASSLTLPR